MKKILFVLLSIIIVLLVSMHIVLGIIRVEITGDDLPENIYENKDQPSLFAYNLMLQLLNPLNNQNEVLAETLLNYILFDSIQTNINEAYDPLGDCEEDACLEIIALDFGYINYAYAELNEDEKIVLTISFARDGYPKIRTAVYIYIDMEVSFLKQNITFTIESIHLAGFEISPAMIDRMMASLDEEAINEQLAYGTIDWENRTYTVKLSEFIIPD